MPLLGYFVVVGSALIGLLYVVDAVFPHDTHQISRKFESIPQVWQMRHTAPVLAPAPKPSVSSTAVLASTPQQAGEPSQKINAASASVAQDPPPHEKRKHVARKRKGQGDFAQADGWSNDRAPNEGSHSRRWRDPFWGSESPRAYSN